MWCFLFKSLCYFYPPAVIAGLLKAEKRAEAQKTPKGFQSKKGIPTDKILGKEDAEESAHKEKEKTVPYIKEEETSSMIKESIETSKTSGDISVSDGSKTQGLDKKAIPKVKEKKTIKDDSTPQKPEILQKSRLLAKSQQTVVEDEDQVKAAPVKDKYIPVISKEKTKLSQEQTEKQISFQLEEDLAPCQTTVKHYTPEPCITKEEDTVSLDKCLKVEDISPEIPFPSEIREPVLKETKEEAKIAGTEVTQQIIPPMEAVEPKHEGDTPEEKSKSVLAKTGKRRVKVIQANVSTSKDETLEMQQPEEIHMEREKQKGIKSKDTFKSQPEKSEVKAEVYSGKLISSEEEIQSKTKKADKDIEGEKYQIEPNITPLKKQLLPTEKEQKLSQETKIKLEDVQLKIDEERALKDDKEERTVLKSVSPKKEKLVVEEQQQISQKSEEGTATTVRDTFSKQKKMAIKEQVGLKSVKTSAVDKTIEASETKSVTPQQKQRKPQAIVVEHEPISISTIRDETFKVIHLKDNKSEQEQIERKVSFAPVIEETSEAELTPERYKVIIEEEFQTGDEEAVSVPIKASKPQEETQQKMTKTKEVKQIPSKVSKVKDKAEKVYPIKVKKQNVSELHVPSTVTTTPMGQEEIKIKDFVQSQQDKPPEEPTAQSIQMQTRQTQAETVTAVSPGREGNKPKIEIDQNVLRDTDNLKQLTKEEESVQTEEREDGSPTILTKDKQTKQPPSLTERDKKVDKRSKVPLKAVQSKTSVLKDEYHSVTPLEITDKKEQVERKISVAPVMEVASHRTLIVKEGDDVSDTAQRYMTPDTLVQDILSKKELVYKLDDITCMPKVSVPDKIDIKVENIESKVDLVENKTETVSPSRDKVAEKQEQIERKVSVMSETEVTDQPSLNAPDKHITVDRATVVTAAEETKTRSKQTKTKTALTPVTEVSDTQIKEIPFSKSKSRKEKEKRLGKETQMSLGEVQSESVVVKDEYGSVIPFEGTETKQEKVLRVTSVVPVMEVASQKIIKAEDGSVRSESAPQMIIPDQPQKDIEELTSLERQTIKYISLASQLLQGQNAPGTPTRREVVIDTQTESQDKVPDKDIQSKVVTIKDETVTVLPIEETKMKAKHKKPKAVVKSAAEVTSKESHVAGDRPKMHDKREVSKERVAIKEEVSVVPSLPNLRDEHLKSVTVEGQVAEVNSFAETKPTYEQEKRQPTVPSLSEATKDKPLIEQELTKPKESKTQEITGTYKTVQDFHDIEKAAPKSIDQDQIRGKKLTKLGQVTQETPQEKVDDAVKTSKQAKSKSHADIDMMPLHDYPVREPSVTDKTNINAGKSGLKADIQHIQGEAKGRQSNKEMTVLSLEPEGKDLVSFQEPSRGIKGRVLCVTEHVFLI